MKKILLILCALMLTAVGASAQTWTAPQPTASSLTSGNDYYLYNVGANGFLVNGNNYLTQASLGSQGLITTVTNYTDGWAIMFESVVGTWSSHENCYLYYTSDGGGKLWCDKDDLDESCYFTITEEGELDDTYIIVSSQATDTYVGWDEEDGGTIVSPIIEEVGANTYWQFITADNYNVYLAKIDLYDALVEAEEMGMTDSDTAYKDAGDVYTSTSATVAEIEVALEELIEAMESHASADHPVDVTSFYITNPSFDTGDLTGWTNSVNSGFAYHADPHTNGDITISGYAEAYVSPSNNLGNRKLYQTLSLPKGTYKLEADANATQQGDESVTVTGVYLYASSLFTSMTSVHTGNGLPEHYSVSFEVAEEGSVEIGFEVSNSDANWVCVDNFVLYYLGEEVTALTDTESDYSAGDEATIYGHKYDVKSNNMVENHSFELGFTGWTGANDFATEITSSNFELRSGDAQNGDVYLVGTVNGGSSAASSLGKAWAIESGKTYYFSYWIKNLAEATNTEYLKTSLTNTPGTETIEFSEPESVSADWQKVEYLFTNTNYEYVQVKFRWLNSQWGFDNFQLYEVSLVEETFEDDSEYKINDLVNADGYECTIKSSNMFVNGGFNEDMYGWTAGGYFVTANPDNFDIKEEGGFNEGAYLVASSAGTADIKTPSQAIAVEEGKTYLFIGYTSGKTPDNGNLQYNALFKMSDAVSEASSDKIIVQLEWGADPTETAEEWTKTMAVFTVPAEEEDGTFPYVGMRMGWSGGSYDGFQLYEVDAKELEYPVDVTWALANPSFEVDKVENLTEDATRSTSEAGDYTGGAYTIDGLTGWTLGGNNAVKDLMTEACKRTDNNFGAPGTPTNGTQMLYLRNNTSTTGYVEQTITLPAGEYMLTVDSKCVSTNSASAVLVAGGKSTALDIHSSYENGDELLDWDTAMLTFSLYATTDVTIGVDISYSGTGSFLLDNFKLYSVEAITKEISWTMTDAGWGTMILPFDATLEGLTAYSCNGTEESTDEDGNVTTVVSLTEVGQSIAANTPYIIKCTDEDAITTHEFKGTPTNTADTYTVGVLTGTLVDLAVAKGAAFATDGTQYLLQNQEEVDGVAFYPIVATESADATLDAYHCYLTIESEEGEASPTKLSIVLPSSGETTAIKAVESDVIANGAIYDLSGRRVSKAVKGVYIQNGKKVLVK